MEMPGYLNDRSALDRAINDLALKERDTIKAAKDAWVEYANARTMLSYSENEATIAKELLTIAQKERAADQTDAAAVLAAEEALEGALKDLSEKYMISSKSLSNRINIKGDLLAKGILDVSLVSGDPKKDQSLLEDLSILYVNYASSRTQKKLSDGLAFLSNQEPAIKIKNAELLSKLEQFRRENNFVDPLVEGENLKEYINSTKRDIAGLESQFSIIIICLLYTSPSPRDSCASR